MSVPAMLATITGDENVFILAPRPGDESLICGGLIAEACARGRPPFVAILTDGSSCGPMAERSVRQAVAALGLPAPRLLMVGLHDNTVPQDGPPFNMLVKAVTLVMWARDCNVICVPCQDLGADHRAARAIAEAVAAASGVGLLFCGAGPWHLDVRAHGPALRAAAQAYGMIIDPVEELFSRGAVQSR